MSNTGADAKAIAVTPRIGRWVAGLTSAAVPPDVLTHLKMCLLDTLGCGLYGAAQPWGRITGDFAVSLSAGGVASLFQRPEKVSPPDAALANGTAIHGFEIDDAHVSSSLHPGAVTVPACLAMAQARDRSGADFLLAMAAGYEVGLRVGICAGVSHSTSGFHVTGTVGVFSAAAAAARLLHLSAEQTAHALGIAATQAAGLYSARKGAMTKRLHAGRAAQSGVMAACLAERGFTGSLEAIEAPFGGFMSAMHGQFQPTTILDGLGDNWESANVGLKAYAACASAHTTIDGVRELRRQGLTSDSLARLTIRMSKKSHINIGWPYEPAEIITAQMNGYYAAAVSLLDGDAFIDQYSETRIADPAIMALIKKIEIVHDPELDLAGAGKRHAVRIEAIQKDGSALNASVVQRRGSATHPLSMEDVEQKFRKLSEGALTVSEADELIDVVARIERLESIDRVVELITKPNDATYSR